METYNGRVDILSPIPDKIRDAKMYQESGKGGGDRSAAESLASIQQLTPLSKLFFSRQNQQIIQNIIRRQVWEKTDHRHVIDEQDYLQLQLVMRSIYLQYCRNIPHNFQKQIEELNAKVCDFCVDRVYNNLLQYLTYKNDVSTLPVPLAQPIKIVKDRKQSLVLHNFF